MTFCSITLYQIKPASEAEYYALLTETSRRKKEMKRDGAIQVINGQNKPKFTASIILWNEEKNFQSWYKDRTKSLDHRLEYSGDVYFGDVILNKKTEFSGNESDLYCSFSKYVIKKGTQKDYIAAYRSLIADANLEDFGAKQTLSMLVSKSNSIFYRITIWESKEDWLKWRAAGTQIALLDKYSEHYIDTMEFKVLSVLFS